MIEVVHFCDQCPAHARAPLGEEIADGWKRMRSGALYCSERCLAIAQGSPAPRSTPLVPDDQERHDG